MAVVNYLVPDWSQGWVAGESIDLDQHVSSYYEHMCPHTPIYGSSYYYIWVAGESLDLDQLMSPHTTSICVLILIYMGPSSYYYTTISGSVFPGVRNERDNCQKRYAVSGSRSCQGRGHASVYRCRRRVQGLLTYADVC